MEYAYELWDFESANLVNAYPSPAAALAVVANYVRAHGQESVERWSLLRAVTDDDYEVIAEGTD